jgi:hypothetical protein
MTLRILFTLAILVGLAAAPSAQTFRWQAGRGTDVSDRVERALEQAQRGIERQWRSIERQWDLRVRAAERATDLAQRNAQRRADAIARQVQRSVQAQVNREIRGNIRANVRGTWVAPRFNNDTRYIGAQVGTDSDPCRDNWDGDNYRHCEVRDFNLPAGALSVDGGSNGGIHVEGWDRNEIHVRAIVRGNARESDARAREIAGQVRVEAGSGRVYATGPEAMRREGWSVSYRINVPRKNDLDLNASNGGITIIGVNGNLRFDTNNGGVRLTDVGGRVSGNTRNGGLNVALGGNRWDGEGLDVETSNGGVTVAIPEGYNAEFETRTSNGGLRIDFPITVQGELTARRGISTTLGSGGPPVRLRTTNGGVRVERR